jgi:hypothetical protein
LSRYLHGNLTKEEAVKLLAASNGLSKDGKFLFRKKGNTSDVVLSVVFKGKASHHSVVTSTSDGKLMLNNNPTGQTTLDELAE